MNLKHTKDGGWYEIGGKKYVGVTTVTGALPKPQLWAWKAKKAAESGDAQAGDKEAKKAADRGTGIHDYIEAWNSAKPLPAVAEGDLGYVAAFRNFVERHHPQVLEQEQTVRNDAEGYAGTLDVVYMMHGNCVGVADYKTVTNPDHIEKYGPWLDHWVQVEAYRQALFSMMVPWYPYRWVIRLGPGGEFGLSEKYAENSLDTHSKLCYETFIAAKNMVVAHRQLKEYDETGMAAFTAARATGGQQNSGR